MDSLGRSPRLKDIPMKSAQDSHVIKNFQSQLWTARSTGSSYLSSGRSRMCQWLTKTKRLKYTGCKKDVPLNRRLLKSLLHTYTGRSLRSWYPKRKDRTCSTSSLQLLSVICCYQHVSELSSLYNGEQTKSTSYFTNSQQPEMSRHFGRHNVAKQGASVVYVTKSGDMRRSIISPQKRCGEVATAGA